MITNDLNSRVFSEVVYTQEVICGEVVMRERVTLMVRITLQFNKKSSDLKKNKYKPPHALCFQLMMFCD